MGNRKARRSRNAMGSRKRWLNWKRFRGWRSLNVSLTCLVRVACVFKHVEHVSEACRSPTHVWHRHSLQNSVLLLPSSPQLVWKGKVRGVTFLRSLVALNFPLGFPLIMNDREVGRWYAPSNPSHPNLTKVLCFQNTIKKISINLIKVFSINYYVSKIPSKKSQSTLSKLFQSITSFITTPFSFFLLPFVNKLICNEGSIFFLNMIQTFHWLMKGTTCSKDTISERERKET